MIGETFRLPLYRPLPGDRRADRGIAEGALLSRVRLGGDSVEQLESLMADYLRTPQRVVSAVNSFAAVFLVAEMLGLGRGDRVLCPSMASFRAIHPLLLLGIEPMFVDSEASSWNVDAQAIDRYLQYMQKENPEGNLPRAIWVCDNYGAPCDMRALSQLSMRYGLPLVEYLDSSLGAVSQGVLCGSWATYSVIPMGGDRVEEAEWGAVITAPTPEAARRVRFLSRGAHEKAPFDQYIQRGYDMSLSPIMAERMILSLEQLPREMEQTHRLEALYRQLLSPIAGVRLLSSSLPHGSEGNGSRMPLLIDKDWLNFSNQELMLRLQEKGMQSRRFYRPMHLHPLYKKSQALSPQLAEELFDRGVLLPIGGGITEVEVEEVCSTIRDLVLRYNS